MNVECGGLVYPEPRRAAAFEPVAALEKFRRQQLYLLRVRGLSGSVLQEEGSS
jgi:hypothetical protein